VELDIDDRKVESTMIITNTLRRQITARNAINQQQQSRPLAEMETHL